MSERPEITGYTRVVVFAAGTQRAETLSAHCVVEGTEVVTAPHAYAAALEILTTDKAVLVLDMSAYHFGCQELAALAGRRDAPVLGVGPQARHADKLDDIPLIKMVDLPEYLAWALSGGKIEVEKTEPDPEPPPLLPQSQAPPEARPADLPASSEQVLTQEEIAALLKRES